MKQQERAIIILCNKQKSMYELYNKIDVLGIDFPIMDILDEILDLLDVPEEKWMPGEGHFCRDYLKDKFFDMNKSQIPTYPKWIQKEMAKKTQGEII